MKLLRAIFLVFALSAVAAPVLPAAADAPCSCTCCQAELVAFGSGEASGSTVICKSDSEDTKPETVASKSACDNLCKGKGDYQKRSCLESQSCWCLGDKNIAYKKAMTVDAAACEAACSAVGQKAAGFGNTPPRTSSSAGINGCPPGGIWKQAECEAVKDSDGVRLAKWDPPSGQTEGPYCFADSQVKVGVNIGGLTRTNLAQYLATAYRLGLGVAAVLAVIFIMIGGFQYLAAAGGSGIERAKERIKNAVIGLVLTVASYTLLQTVNPDILNLRLPRVQLIRACNLQVDCGSRHDKETCERNTTEGMRCVWNIAQSLCYDNSAMESGLGVTDIDCDDTHPCKEGICFDVGTGKKKCSLAGKLNGPCNPDGSCSQGRCVDTGVGWRGKVCTDGSVCQVCNSDTAVSGSGKPDAAVSDNGQCQLDQNGKPMKCIDHQCAPLDPDGSGKYKACANTSCSSNADCASGFCNAEKKCAQGAQGNICLVGGDGDCDTKGGYSCVTFERQTGKTAACCLSGKEAGCLGCGGDNDCPADMFCASGTRYNVLHKNIPDIITAQVEFKCMPDAQEGQPCFDGPMCPSGVCKSGTCQP